MALWTHPHEPTWKQKAEHVVQQPLMFMIREKIDKRRTRSLGFVGKSEQEGS